MFAEPSEGKLDLSNINTRSSDSRIGKLKYFIRTEGSRQGECYLNLMLRFPNGIVKEKALCRVEESEDYQLVAKAIE